MKKFFKKKHAKQMFEENKEKIEHSVQNRSIILKNLNLRFVRKKKLFLSLKG